MTDGVQVQDVLIWLTKTWKTKKKKKSAHVNETQAVQNLNYVGKVAVARN